MISLGVTSYVANHVLIATTVLKEIRILDGKIRRIINDCDVSVRFTLFLVYILSSKAKVKNELPSEIIIYRTCDVILYAFKHKQTILN